MVCTVVRLLLISDNYIRGYKCLVLFDLKKHKSPFIEVFPTLEVTPKQILEGAL